MCSPTRCSGHRVDRPRRSSLSADGFDQSRAGGPADPDASAPHGRSPRGPGALATTRRRSRVRRCRRGCRDRPAGVVAVDRPGGDVGERVGGARTRRRYRCGSMAGGDVGQSVRWRPEPRGATGAGDDPAGTSVVGRWRPILVVTARLAATVRVDDPAGTSVGVGGWGARCWVVTPRRVGEEPAGTSVDSVGGPSAGGAPPHPAVWVRVISRRGRRSPGRSRARCW